VAIEREVGDDLFQLAVGRAARKVIHSPLGK
jgi:hypothetical protein